MNHLVINPAAGHGRARLIGENMAAWLMKNAIPHSVSYTEGESHATTLAREAAAKGATSVIAVGGDGTVCETARGLLDTGAALGIIPAGTGNDFAKSLHLPAAPEEALPHLLKTPPRPLDIGHMNDAIFLNVCGTGFDAKVLDYAKKAKKYAGGMFPYLYGVLRTILTYRAATLSISIDEEPAFEKKVLMLGAANGRYIGGGMLVAPHAQPNDGLFDLILVDNLPNWKMPAQLIKLLTGRILEIPGATIRRCKRAQVIPASGDLRLNLDGELITAANASFEIQPGRLMAHW